MLELFSWGNSGWGDELFSGLKITVALALTTLPFGLAIGFIVASGSLAPRRPAQMFANGYTTMMRGLPELLTLFLVYNGVGMGLNSLLSWAIPNAPSIIISPFVAGVVALALVFGAFAAEVLRGAFQSLDRGQIEAAMAIGMRPYQIFLRVKLPQIWRFALPGIGNLWISLLKDTSLVSVISLNDIMRVTKVAVGVTKQPFTFYLAACCLYWLMCILSEIALGRMEKRASRGVRGSVT
ncbi:ABC transporter permease [Thioclava sp. GXIMD4215]|uniref:ABC transporter permease n=1 Tax=Thioclava sp. GXIMD4215 TaxID=3131928 RepID=UPI00311B00BB